jgi:hypothetical protein
MASLVRCQTIPGAMGPIRGIRLHRWHKHLKTQERNEYRAHSMDALVCEGQFGTVQ